MPALRRLGVAAPPKGSRMEHLVSLLSVDPRGNEEGQGLAEYALVLALIAIIAIVALIFLGNQVQTIISNVGTNI
jgi:pilus assembly protein Flp/PilA